MAGASPGGAAVGESGLPARLVSIRGRPTWLIWLFLMWQATVLASAGALLLWQREPWTATGAHE